ncbi:CHAT domain-containing protein [Kitasatospora acidiphila]|uniref:CHAT domain-containing protein n=1 Tax=Kitasatospora acidiphila TaxID=2567942 RepID=UPI0015F0BA8D|nr:CHAT domain-containing protein [Kitasatospora acidiphila]
MKGYLQKGGPVSWRLAVYDHLIALLRPTYGVGGGTSKPDCSGWVWLLNDAGHAAFELHERDRAISLFDEAWNSRAVLRLDALEGAKAVAHTALQYEMVAGYLPDLEQRGDCIEVALPRLAEARRMLLRHVPNLSLRSLFLAIGVGVGECWRNLRKLERVGWLKSADNCLTAYRLVESDLEEARSGASVEFQPGDNDYESLPHNKVVRYLLDSAGAAEIFGEYELASTCARKAMTLITSDDDEERMRARLQLIRLERDRTARVDGYEQLLRGTEFGNRGTWPRLGSKIGKQLADAASDVSKTLDHLERPTASWFWSRLSNEWRPGVSTAPVAARRDRTRPASRRAASGTPDALSNSHIGELEHKLRSEHVPGLVHVLLDACHDVNAVQSEPALLDELCAVDHWRPPHRGWRVDRLPVCQCTSAADVKRVCLEIADEFAQGYAPHFRPEILSRLAATPGLNAGQCHAVAQEAYQVSRKGGHFTEAIRAQLALVRSHHQPESPGKVEGVIGSAAAACNVVRDSLAVARGTADLIDVAHSLTTPCARIAGLLASQGYDEWAFNAAHAPIGALIEAFTQNPDLVKEFELAEGRQRGGTSHVEEWLFDMMLARVTTEPVSPPTRAPASPAEVAARFGPRVTFVQLLDTRQHGAWALGAGVTDGSSRYWSSRIDVPLSWLKKIREDITNRITARGSQESLIDDLKDLHNKAVAPWLDQVAGAEIIVLILHRDFAGLPIHAALGPGGYMVEKFRVGYLPNLDLPPPSPGVLESAFLGGWHHGIHARDEVDSLEPWVENLGFTVTKPRRAAEGHHLILDRDREWGIIHIVADCDFQQWPLSSTSRLNLTKDVSVSAYEWLHWGCRASLAFLNACSSGLQIPHAGDLNGFPLALRVRGVTAEISCSAPVRSGAAHNFAKEFYSRLAECDTLSAYQGAQRAILRGCSPVNWIQYLHVGFPVFLNLRTAEVAL